MTYTYKEVIEITKIYTDNPCMETVRSLSVRLNRPVRSVISKLVKEGVYITKGYRAKDGTVPITKLDIVRSIEDAIDYKLPGLDKAPKGTLKILNDSITDLSTHLEEAMHDLAEYVELGKIRKEMQNKDEIFEILR